MKLNFIISIFIIFVISSCEKQSSDLMDISQSVTNISEVAGLSDVELALTRQAVIGKKLPNPYSIDVMNEALNNLKTKSDIGDFELRATHHYIMFKPECHEHYRSLIMQDDIDLNSFPLDHEISSGWVVVNPDPAFSTNGYSHKWSYVPVERDLSDINCPYEILYDIVSLDEETTATKGTDTSQEMFRLIEEEAHSLCGMELEIVPQTKAKTTPYGNIKYYDSSYGKEVGCSGMTVRAHRLTKKAYGHCDDNGNFTCDKDFTYKWTYTIFWGRTDFEIRDGIDSKEQISLVFTNQDGPLYLNFNSLNYPDHMFHCEILRAACKYFYGEIDGLNRPPFKDELKDRIYIQAVKGRDTGGSNGFFSYVSQMNSLPYIRIFKNDANSNNKMPAAEIYFNTIHEIAHSAHWKVNPSLYYNNCHTKVKESFASGVGMHLTRKVHPTFSWEYWGNYTGVVEDLMDNDGLTSHSSVRYSENVSGFTIREIEKSIEGATTWNGWRDNIISMYPYNPSISNVNSLFTVW